MSVVVERALLVGSMSTEIGYRGALRLGATGPGRAMSDLDVLERAIAAGVAVETGHRVGPRLGTNGAAAAVEACIELSGHLFGRFVLTVPRTLLGPLFVDRLPGHRGAEAELADALRSLAVAICEHVLVSFGIAHFELAPPAIRDASPTSRPALAIAVLDQWIAAELVEDALTSPTRLRVLR